MRLRHRLVPYIYTMNVRSCIDGHSLIEPMYYDHPQVDQAYKYKNQYMFGTELLVAPITEPRSKASTYAKTTAWLPPGRYVDIFNNNVYDGDREVSFHRPLDKCPVLAKQGAIIPLDGAEIPGNGCLIPTSLEISLVVGADGSFELVEDAGIGAAAEDIEFSKTPIQYTHATGTLTIGPTSNPLVPMRKWSVRLLSFTAAEGSKITATRDGQPMKARSESTENGTLVEVGTVPGFETIKLSLGTDRPALDKTAVKKAVFTVLDDGQIQTDAKNRIWKIVQAFGEVPVQVMISRLTEVGVAEEVREAVMECVLADSRC